MSKIEYQRLTRATAITTRLSTGSLWLAADHLLSIDSGHFIENYRRFYFRDIQAITIEKTKTWTIWNYILGVAVFITLVSAIVDLPKGPSSQWSGTDGVAAIIFGGFATLFGIFLVIHLLLGPTCKCYLRTAVQIEEFPSLRRLRKTRKILERIRPLITAAQDGELSPQTIAEKMREPTRSPVAATSAPVENPDLPPKLDS